MPDPPASQPPIPPHLSPAVQPNFDWNYIWTFFANAPRVRAWLFQKDPPLSTHVVQSLLSSPMLVGYIFGSNHESTRLYAFPDIGDLQTVYCRDGDALLGFNFGFKGVQPVMPLLFQVIRDPMLANPTVRVRRTAKQRAPPPFQNYFLCIEFCWFESGALMVVTSVCPSDPDAVQPTGLCPMVLHADHRIFSARTANRWSAIAESLAQQVDLAYFPDPSHFAPLPPEFLNPPDDYYYLTVREPDDLTYHSQLEPAYVPITQFKKQTFSVEKEIPLVNTPTTTANSSSTSSTSNTAESVHTSSNDANEESESLLDERAGASLDTAKGDVTSIADEGTVKLWQGYQRKVAQSRRTGIIITMLGKKQGLYAQQTNLFGRDSRYVFLSTSGIRVNGRIQRLCSQLGIQMGSPLPDQLLLAPKDEDVPIVEELDAGGNVNASNAAAVNGAVDPFRQGLDHAINPIGIVNAPANMLSPIANGNDPWATNEGSLHSSILMQGGTMSNGEYSADGKGLSYGARHPKRRRCAPVYDSKPEPEINQHSFISPLTMQQPADPLLNKGIDQLVTAETANPLGFSTPRDDASRRRSFDLDHILSNEDVVYPPELSRKSSPESIQDIPSSTDFAPVEITSSARDAKDVSIQPESEQRGEESKASADTPKSKANKTVWTCDRCGVQIRGKKGNLNRHIANKHDNIRAFACKREGCGRRFQTRLNLVRHETAVHDGRPFTCPNCPRAFKYEDDLKAHIKSAHDEPDAKLACQVCGSCFGRRSTLNRHMAKVHKIKQPSAQSAAQPV